MYALYLVVSNHNFIPSIEDKTIHMYALCLVVSNHNFIPSIEDKTIHMYALCLVVSKHNFVQYNNVILFFFLKPQLLGYHLMQNGSFKYIKAKI